MLYINKTNAHAYGTYAMAKANAVAYRVAYRTQKMGGSYVSGYAVYLVF